MREPTVAASRQLKPSAFDADVQPMNLPLKSRIAIAKTNPHAVPESVFRLLVHAACHYHIPVLIKPKFVFRPEIVKY